MTGANTAGVIFLISSCMTAAAVGYAWSSLDRIGLLELFTNPTMLLILVIANLVFGAIRVIAARHAWRRAGGRAFSLGILALLLFTAIPHIAIGYVGLETRSALVNVFSSPPVGVIAAPAATTTIATTTTMPPGDPIVTPWEIPNEPSTTTSTTTTIPLGAERVTFLLLGGDAGPGRSGLRTDSMMVATIDTVSGDAAIFGLPRNMAGFKFSDGTDFPGLGQGILNEVYMWGRKNPERFPGPDPGIAAISDVAQTLLGLPIDHYVLVDMIGFARLVDVIGGVDIEVNNAMAAPLYDRSTGGHETIQFAPGRQHMDGDTALAYSRSRTDSNDYKRMARQRCVISAVADQAGPLTLMTRLPALLDVLETSVSTDIPINDLPYLINLAPRVSSDRISVVGFDLDYRSGNFTAGGFATPDVDKIQKVVQQAISDQWESGPFALDTAAASCG
jgi:polyisoprenyl-teichoic acid--peptidoglycan teichoic acid transferase